MKNKKVATCIIRSNALDYLSDMIKINSVTGNEGIIGEYIIQKLTSFGIVTEKQYASPERFNIVARIKGNQPGPVIMLAGHIDTVSATYGWATDPFKPVLKDGRIYGLGSNDMKAGNACILATAEVLGMRKAELAGEVILAFIPDEEAYSIGVNKLVESGIRADFCIMAEPHFERILVGAVGKLLIHGVITGVASHGATPWLGINAVEEAAKFLAALHTIELPCHEKLAPQKFVTLKIDGGYKEYSITVPAKCEFQINKHTVPGEDKKEVLTALNGLAERLNLKAKVEFEIIPPSYPPYEMDVDNPWIAKLSDCYRAVMGREAGYEYSDGVSDVNILVPAGIPTVCLGPYGENMHSVDEWVDIESIGKICDIYMKFLLS